MPARYRLEHLTRYTYSTPVATSQHVACLRPRELPYQHVRTHAITVEPAPASRRSRTDYFGNVVDHFQILRPHTMLTVVAAGSVDVLERPELAELQGAPAWPVWEEVREMATWHGGALPPDVVQFVSPSPYVPAASGVETLARAVFSRRRSILDAALALTHDIYRRFTFDPAATMVTTPLTRVLEEERGVCQDFAHVAIACFRAVGLPARYVSGYLLTDPPPGQPRLVGADASHAWLSFFCPPYGWIDIDPTNDTLVSARYITVAWGRDYGDVSPLRGVLLGGAEHTLHVGVSVLPDSPHLVQRD
jgi:transglutaminase-like putative cysteine protease